MTTAPALKLLVAPAMMSPIPFPSNVGNETIRPAAPVPGNFTFFARSVELN